MKTTPVRTRAREKAWALLVVMALAAAGLLLVASVMAWANENATVTARNSEFFTTTYAAEAATEKALGAIVQDDQNYGEGLVLARSAAGYYGSLIPTAHDSSYWTNYQFSGGTTNNTVIVECINTSTTNVLGPPYSGLQSVGATYEIVASAKNNNSMYGITATVGQQVVLGQIPIFQFAIFYNDNLEIDPGANMNVNGMVHGNTNVYIDPNSGVVLTFSNDVSATGTLNLSANPLDPSGRPAVGSATFNGNHLADVNPLNLPVGTNVSGSPTNVSDSVSAILQVPPPGESPGSAIGTNRLYNQVDMIITITNGNVITVTSGVGVNNAATVISNAPFVSTNGAFYNMRDGAEVAPVNIDVGQLRQWSATNTALAPLLTAIRGASESAVQSIFVVDQRYLSNTVIITNYTLTTNTATTTTTSYPGPGTYFPPVTTNTIVGASSSKPAANTYVPPILSTNLTSTTTSSPPGSGTYVGSITTNTTLTVSTTHPASGTYSGSITTNIIAGVKTYTYNALSYTYNVVSGYIYNEITGYTYAGITGTTTNVSYTTNLVQYAEPGVVLTNGATLPPNGLSVVTPDPLYIVGNWNVTNNSGQGMVQTYNVSDTLPSAVFADAVTILSPAWNPVNSSAAISLRNAAPDTVNAAILTGNVPSNGSYYSGGVENFPRFQENWSGVNFYYNGSMVEMFSSRIAAFPWPGTGTVYNPPVRDWAFDTNFSNPSKLPPLTPKVIYLNRARWSSLAPGSTWF